MKFCHFFSLAVALILAAAPFTPAQTDPETILQKEAIRRQEILLRAVQEIEATESLVAEGKTEEAKRRLADILRTIPEQGEGAPVYEKAASLLSNIELTDARRALEQKKWFEARDGAIRALGFNPENAAARQILAAANRELGIKNNDESTLNPAVDRKFVDNINRVQDLIKQGQDHMTTGAFDAAENKFNQALIIDPYNKVASKELKKLYGKRRIAAEVARYSSRQERLTETREGWTQKVETERAPELTATPVQPIRRTSNFAISQKLNSIIIPSVDFNEASIADAANFLTVRTRELDPDGIGVSVLLRSEAVAANSAPITLRLTNVPAGEVLRYAANLAGVKYRIEEFAVFVVPLAEPDNLVLITREFPVRPTFFDVAPTADTGAPGALDRRRTPRTTTVQAAAGSDSVRDALESRGVSFTVDGSAAFYNQSTGILTVRNTQDQIDLVEELVTDEATEALVVRVDTRFVEINQTDLDSLAFNAALAGSYTPNAGGTRIAAGTVRVATNLQGANGVRTSDGINSIINLDPSIGSAANPSQAIPATNRLGIGGSLDGNAFRALIESISQKSSADIMTAPSIVVNDGQQGQITVAREFYYPTEFDEPQVTPPVLITNTLVVPAWPTQFEARNVGVVMNVQPRITVDRQRVFLTIKPEITDFDGYINYGAAVRSGAGDFTQVPGPGGVISLIPIPAGTLISNNVINQPVFSVRTVENAQLEIQDGHTMVLGGLIREDISTVEDKVPLLGDIPLVGRLFRSKAEQAVKKNLLIFVTVRILRPDGEPFNVNAGQPVAQTR